MTDPETGAGACAAGAVPDPCQSATIWWRWSSRTTRHGRPLYEVTREEDLKSLTATTFIPQIPPPACAGPLHVVDVKDSGTDGYELPWRAGQFLHTGREPQLCRRGRQPLRGPGDAAVQRQAGQPWPTRKGWRPSLRCGPRCRSPGAGGATSSTTSTSRPTRWSSPLAKRPAWPTCPSASMTIPAGWCTP